MRSCLASYVAGEVLADRFLELYIGFDHNNGRMVIWAASVSMTKPGESLRASRASGISKEQIGAPEPPSFIFCRTGQPRGYGDTYQER